MTELKVPYNSIPEIRTFINRKSPLIFKFLILVLILMMGTFIHAQDTTNTKIGAEKETARPHTIKKATLYSVFLPGAGQAYNKKYWKIPIVYAGFGVFTYFIVVNTQEFREFQEAYTYKVNGYTYPIDNEYVDKYSTDQLKSGMDDYRRNRDLSIIFAVVWYALQILDANVDAHFYDYDISEDISLHWEPVIAPVSLHLPESNPTGITGVKICLKF